MDNTFDTSLTSKTKSDEDHSKLQSLCLQTEKKNKASLSIPATDFITWDGKSDNNTESGLRNAINSDANIPSSARSAMFDRKTDCHQVNIIGSFNNYNVACVMPRGQSLQPINAKTQESEKNSNCCPSCPAFICRCCNAAIKLLKKLI
ncbi:hypothetical protein T07_4445 [Trichinella nelsoni]|uniref:Uncharacterized protein n=1 Tax=Trichinella nelsoni TaxID=6336 RepID=A0A0V0SFD4_9BILA|nr:hypothetical protein T07_4445 [Trichinella nelsoni]